MKQFFRHLTFLTILLTTQTALASYQIPNGSVTAAKIASDAVITAKILDANVTRAKLAQGANARRLVVSATSTHSLNTAVTDILVLSSSAFTVTLPTAVGIEGYEVTLKHAGSNLVAYSIATTSAQTVCGIASGSYKLMTAGETVTLYSDNANWQCRQHSSYTGRISYTPTITGFGTPTNVAGYWWREGRDMVLQISFSAGTASGSLASATLPSGVNIDTTLTLNPTTSGPCPTIEGTLTANTANPQRGMSLACTGTSTTIIYAGSNANPLVPATGSGAFTSTQVHSWNARVPIAEFQP